MKKIWMLIALLAISTSVFAGGGTVPKYVQCADKHSVNFCQPKFGDPRLMNEKFKLNPLRTLIPTPDGKAWSLNFLLDANGNKILNPICPEGGAKQGRPTCYDPSKTEYDPNGHDACWTSVKNQCLNGSLK